ncbi:MAG: protein kinase [Rhodopirellula sp.]|nr:protein kinase [Rhodopirellula sp.]
MAQITSEQIAERALDLGLVGDRQLQEVWSSFGSRSISADDFLAVMVRRELLTNYQVERLVKGERTGFFFGDYKVLYLMGTGTFARVYRAVHKDTGQVVAVKVLRKRYTDSSSQCAQFVREGQVGSSLRHPNIVPIYEVVSQRRMHFLVMEFVEGRNLREFMKIRRKLEPDQATRLMIDVASGMQYAFERGLSHRDLKMSNVLVSSLGTAKIVDFGLAAAGDSSSDEALLNSNNPRTVDYAALERASGVRKDDTRSDIYFMGCMYYHMLTGVPPLVETTDRTLRLSKNRFLQIVPIQKLDAAIPNNVAAVVGQAMMLDPDNRYQTPGRMLTDLRNVARRLAEGDTGEPTDAASSPQVVSSEEEEQQQAILIVESDPQLQNVFRNGFKRVGYRVLLVSDPDRAVDRFQQDSNVAAADCVIFSAQNLGKSAVSAFNRLGEQAKSASVPALLLLDEPQAGWGQEAKTAPHRVVLNMPLTLKELRGELAKLLPAKLPSAADREV